MDDFDRSFTESIVSKLTLRIGRSLTQDESDAFRRVRSGIAYEMMMDYISDQDKSKKEIEDYVESVTTENKKTMLSLKVEWWNNHRKKYNRGLAIAGAAAILITAFLYLFFSKSTDEFLKALGIGFIVYLIYMAALNLIFLTIEISDRGLSNDISQRKKNTAFRILFWTSIVIPFSYPIFILTMFYSN